jgi:uncharacterized membrane protein
MSAAWYYAHGNQQHGPVSLDEIRILLASGRLTPADLAWREGLASWAPIRTISELASATAASAPVAGPELAEGTGGQSPKSTSKAVDIGACLNRAWDLYMKEFGALFGVTFLVMVLDTAFLYATRQVSFYTGIYMVNALIQTPLTAGLFWFYLKKIRGETAGVEDLLAGYRMAAMPLVLAALVQGLLIGIGTLFCVLPGLFLGLIWAFTTPLIIDKRLEFWPAMETSRIAVMQDIVPFLLLFLLATGIFLSGILACGVGFIFTAPLSLLVVAYAYNDRFGPPGSTQAS